MRPDTDVPEKNLWLHCGIAFAAGLFAVAAPLQIQASGRELAMETTERRSIALPDKLLRDVVRSPAGDLYFLGSRRAVVHHLSKSTGNTHEISLAQPRELESAEIQRDLHVDQNGLLYLAATWKSAGQQAGAGVFVFDAAGRNTRKIILSPPIMVRHVATDDQGNLFALGVDQEYFWRRTDDCLLIHKYSSEGKRTVAFSACPSHLDLRRMGDVRPGPDAQRLWEEAARGRIWLKKGLVYHLLPVSRQLRIFEGNGSLVKNFVLTPPDAQSVLRQSPATNPDTSNDQIWSLVDLPGGRYLVDWLHIEGGGRFRYLSLHDDEGKPLSAAMRTPWPRSLPKFSEEDGRVCFVRTGNGAQEIIHARIDLR
jgi:hypothetical protein